MWFSLKPNLVERNVPGNVASSKDEGRIILRQDPITSANKMFFFLSFGKRYMNIEDLKFYLEEESSTNG